MAHLLTGTTFRGFTDDGKPLVGGLLYTYLSGTTTPQPTYADSTLTTLNANPAPLNARGEAEIWLDPAKIYTFRLTTAAGATVGTDVDDIQAPEGVLAGTSPGQGASKVGLEDADGRIQSTQLEAAIREIVWRSDAVRIPALKYIPMSYWATLEAGTETADMGAYINQAVSEALPHGGIVQLPGWTLCHSTPIVVGNKGVGFEGVLIKEGVTASSAQGTCLKWTGATGTNNPASIVAQITYTNGAHNPHIKSIHFDANDKADTNIYFKALAGGSTQQIHRPYVGHCAFVGYRGPSLIYGDANTAVLCDAQFEQGLIEHCKWWGGGATAESAGVKTSRAIVLNAQNMEILHVIGCFFDAYAISVGGTQQEHLSHIVVKTGGLHVNGGTMTRATSYDIDVLSECGLVVNHVRTEDLLFLRTASGYPSNPIMIQNVEGRDLTGAGTEDFIYLQSGGGQAILLENIQSTGNISVQGANNCALTTRNIQFVGPASAITSPRILGGTPYAGVYDLGARPGVRKIISDNISEVWQTSSNVVRTKNINGTHYVRGLQLAAGIDPLACVNFCGKVLVSGAATTGTVTFSPAAEADANYMPFLSLDGTTGAPAASSTIVTLMSKSTTGFTFTLAAAPGAGATVTLNWMITRR